MIRLQEKTEKATEPFFVSLQPNAVAYMVFIRLFLNNIASHHLAEMRELFAHSKLRGSQPNSIVWLVPRQSYSPLQATRHTIANVHTKVQLYAKQ